jgi:hypothetical protein
VTTIDHERFCAEKGRRPVNFERAELLGGRGGPLWRQIGGLAQRLDLEPGSHEIEIRGGPSPLKYDVNVTAGQTVTLHAKVK